MTLSDPRLEERSPTWELLRAALPIIAMTVSRMAIGFIDFVMVSQLGTAAQAAISPATLLVFLVSCLGMGCVQSVQTFVSQARGRGEAHAAGAYAWQSLYVAILFGLLTWPLASTAHLWCASIARFAGTPADVAALQAEYIGWCLWQTAPAILAGGLQAFYNGVERSYVALAAVLASLVCVVVGNYVLIWGHWGFPKLGIAGAAIATVASWWVRAAIMLVPLFTPTYERLYRTASSLALDLRKLYEIIRVGGPIALQWLVDLGSWVVFLNLILPRYGQAGLAASNIAIQYMHLAFMPAIGIGVALTSQVGFAIGAQRPDDAVRRTRVAMWLTGAYMGAVGLLMVVGGGPLVWLFNHDSAVIAVGKWVLVWVAIFQVFDAMCITYISAMRGAGDTNVPALMAAFCCWVVFIGGGYAASIALPQFGLHVPWLAATAYIILLGVMVWRRWVGGAWRRMKLHAGAT